MDEQIKEKLLCVLKTNAGDLKKLYCNNILSYKDNSIKIDLYNLGVYEDYKEERSTVVPAKYFWQKDKTENTTVWSKRFSHNVARIEFGGKKFIIEKEEYDEIIKLREEKIKERQLEKLEKLCVSQE